MILKKIGLITMVSMLAFSCSNDTKEYVLRVKLNQLKVQDIYDHNMVADVLFDAQELDVDSLKKKSRELFLKGVDEYKNKKNPAAAIMLFKSSIMIFPDAKTYYELGNALLEFKESASSLEDAVKAFRVAEELDLQPLYPVYYKQACASNLLRQLDKENVYWVIDYLRSSFNHGFSDTSALLKDDRINSIVSTPEYKSLLLELKLKGTEKTENNLFELYKQAYPAAHSTSFEVTKEGISMKAFQESISYDFASFVPEMQNTSFGREVSNDFFYVATIKDTPQYTALVYTSIAFWGEENMSPVLTTLVTYTKSGEIIDRKLIACECSAEKIKTASIKDNTLYIEDYKRVWAQPIDAVSFEDNTVKQYDLLAKATYKIDDAGTITVSDIPANYNDSSMVTEQPKNNPR